MKEIDERIRNSLSAEDRRLLAEIDASGSLYQDVAAAFQGRARWMNMLGSLFGLVSFIVAVGCAWRFFNATDLRDMHLWGGGAALAFLANAMIKLWFWIELKSISIVREIKRVELQVVSLGAALRADRPR